jgi:hypothetical protein
MRPYRAPQPIAGETSGLAGGDKGDSDEEAVVRRADRGYCSDGMAYHYQIAVIPRTERIFLRHTRYAGVGADSPIGESLL